MRLEPDRLRLMKAWRYCLLKVSSWTDCRWKTRLVRLNRKVLKTEEMRENVKLGGESGIGGGWIDRSRLDRLCK